MLVRTEVRRGDIPVKKMKSLVSREKSSQRGPEPGDTPGNKRQQKEN